MDLNKTFTETEESQYHSLKTFRINKTLVLLLVGLLVVAKGYAHVSHRHEVVSHWDGAGSQWTCGNCGTTNYKWQMSCSNCGTSQ